MDLNIIEDMKQYIGDDGLVCPRTDKVSSLNGVTYTSEMMIVLQDNDSLTLDLENRLVTALGQCFLQPGLLTRTPTHHPDQEGQDDYIAICTVSALCWLGIADNILLYGKKHWWVFNNVYPGTIWNNRCFEDTLPWWQFWVPRTKKINLSALMFRHMPFVAHVHYSAGKKPNLFWTICWQLAVYYAIKTTKKENQDGWMLTWCLIRSGGDENVINRLLTKKWYANMYQVFPNGLKDLNYLEGNNQHPITRWWIK